MLMFCNGQVSPRIWIQLGTCRDFWKFKSEKIAPANINNLKAICQEEWYKIPTYYCKNLIVNYRKRLAAVEVYKVYSTKYEMKNMRYFLYCTIIFFTHENK